MLPSTAASSCSFRFELSSRDIGDYYRYLSSTTTIPTAPASLAQQSIQGLLKTTFSKPVEAGCVSDDASMSPMEGRFEQRASKAPHFDSGSTDGAPQRTFPSSGVLTTSVTDNRASKAAGVQTMNTPSTNYAAKSGTGLT
ncbi:hypothetical protein ARMSODRAFT_1024726 [Armillaria solidipes]|uniref:Uncharacterized protein n=1 Tax=Armillaria solidipes TaxID=1076256 RepID=A0A2H3BHH7_9AGAR|nr:hypothetical protein ARMSODRAFT_1024726 [Armillaria solidipes]